MQLCLGLNFGVDFKMLKLVSMSEEDFAEYIERSAVEFARGAVIARGASYEHS